ncbi:putative UDP-N-acetylglucosamine 1-carboxyvinyltransferase [Rosa chinensis]|uniref:UDP-N-acetylglucosamine 1-carboxyvinyltransferase n=1 Tax=Rosa chinensis TaxID=74649 RepID=A0A2P6QA37_ROSCH|nr:putative UDP-N-acetylglucosamine 1-carboxyvinyltransferase [Rosa chinensis]
MVNTVGLHLLSLIRKIRGGFFVLGPLVARFGEAVVALLGGCDIRARSVDLYIRGLQALGAVVEMKDGKVQAYALNGRGLVGGSFQLDYPSIGATETLLMAACMADGTTILSSVARQEATKLVIKGKSYFHGCKCTIAPDRIEAGTFLLAAAIARSFISISPVIPSQVSCLMQKLLAAGSKIRQCSHDTLEVFSAVSQCGENLRGFEVKTGPFPGFPEDLQPQTMALLITRNGLSPVEESVFEKRMANVVCLVPALLQLTSLVLAALAAEGTTEISSVAHIDRGYENVDTLHMLGADIKRLMAPASS